jgi:hypothetical protein
MISTAVIIAALAGAPSVSDARKDFAFTPKDAKKAPNNGYAVKHSPTKYSGVKCKAVAKAQNFKISIDAHVSAGVRRKACTLAVLNIATLVALELQIGCSIA